MLERTRGPACHPFPSAGGESWHQDTWLLQHFWRSPYQDPPGYSGTQNCPSVNALFGGGGEMGLQCESVSGFPKPAVELPAIHQCLIPPSSESVTSPKGDSWVEVGLGCSSPLQI